MFSNNIYSDCINILHVEKTSNLPHIDVFLFNSYRIFAASISIPIVTVPAQRKQFLWNKKREIAGNVSIDVIRKFQKNYTIYLPLK